SSPLKESLYCIRCGACLNACPVFRELSGHAYIGKDNSIAPYPGPIGSVISPGFFGKNYVQLAQASSLCGACKEVCPVDIDLPKLLTRVRAGQAAGNSDTSTSLSAGQLSVNSGAGLSPLSKLFMRIYSRIATHPRLFAVSQRFAALGTYLVSPTAEMFCIPAFTGWGYSKDFPRFAARPFRARWKNGLEDGRVEDGKLVNGSTIQTPNLQIPDLPIPNIPIQQFTQELTALSGYVVSTNNPTQAVIDLLKSRGLNKIHLEPNTLDESILHEANIEFTDSPDPSILVGVTKAICGLADTGSVLIVDGEGSPLHASLLPEIHIAVLAKSDILPSLSDAMQLVKDTRAAVFITGPSRTADIEMTLTIGVHGPKEIHVFVVEE
ncbi:MAG: LUD domain-containing protein, partial [Anaerolineales bacterium]|nr:LUD domain-containing protein [Anaerolineales bacterium]